MSGEINGGYWFVGYWFLILILIIMSHLRKIILYIIFVIVVVSVVLFLLSIRKNPKKITYGVSFNTSYARELGLDWKKVYIAILEDLKVKHLRLSALWTMVEPQDNKFDFKELDFQINEAKKHNADVILGVGRRLPRWPECHVPKWAQSLSWKEQKNKIREMITEVVKRYRGNEAILYWQVENEPFLTVFAKQYCGDLDKKFLAEEIALVKKLDPTRPILVTDSGNLGTWAGAYKSGDVFGTSVYVYFWNPKIGPFKSILPPAYYRIKSNIMRLIYGKKKMLIIELSAEPWLLRPVDLILSIYGERSGGIGLKSGGISHFGFGLKNYIVVVN